MPKYKNAPRIIKHRLAFLRGDIFEAGGKELLMRVVQSEPELKMLEEIESQHEPTTYEYKPGMYVDYITPEVCKHIRMIYTALEKNKRQKLQEE